MTASERVDRDASGPADRARAGEDRLRAVVVGVVDAALRERGARGVVLTGPGSPERELLVRWLGERALVPDEGDVGPVRDALAAADPDAPRAIVELEARRSLARTRAAANDLLLASEIHKTALVLGRGLPPEPLLPLGDVWASEVAAVAGGCTLPAALEGLPPGMLASVDEALRAHLEEGRPLAEALAPLEPGLGERLADLLQGRPWGRFRTPLVPKLGPRTVGIDLE